VLYVYGRDQRPEEKWVRAIHKRERTEKRQTVSYVVSSGDLQGETELTFFRGEAARRMDTCPRAGELEKGPVKDSKSAAAEGGSDLRYKHLKKELPATPKDQKFQLVFNSERDLL